MYNKKKKGKQNEKQSLGKSIIKYYSLGVGGWIFMVKFWMESRGWCGSFGVVCCPTQLINKRVISFMGDALFKLFCLIKILRNPLLV